MRFDPLYMLMMLPCMALAAFASWRVKSTFAKYAKVRTHSGYTGARAAQLMLNRNGVNDVAIERISGFLTDHYDPSKKVLRLSPDVYDGNTLSAIGVACHEAGHALQHAQAYAPLNLRSALVPITNLSSNLSVWVFFAGLALQIKPLLIAGCALFAVGLLFALVTLPVEWNASSRAKRELLTTNIVSPDQAGDAGRVLNAAFLTYLAAAFSSLLTLLYYLFRAGLIGGGRSRD